MLANLSTLFSYPSKAWRGKRPDGQGHDWLRGGVPYPDGAFHVLTDQGVLHDEGEAQGLGIRRHARGAWRAAIEAGAYGTERFVALAMVQWPGPSIYPAMSCAETLKPIIDAGTDERLWPDDDNSHCRATVFMEAPGLSAYGVTMPNRNAPCCLSIRLMARNVCSPSSHCVRASTRRM